MHFRDLMNFSFDQVGHRPPFGGLTPIWRLNSGMVYLFYLPNWTYFLFILNKVFFEEKACQVLALKVTQSGKQSVFDLKTQILCKV